MTRMQTNQNNTPADLIGYTDDRRLSSAEAKARDEAVAAQGHNLSRRELRAVRQLFVRSGRRLSECVARVVGRRAHEREVFVTIGSVLEVRPGLHARLREMDGDSRRELLSEVVCELLSDVDVGKMSATLDADRWIVTSDTDASDPLGVNAETAISSLLAERLEI
jgi:hypothetical protein